MRYVEQRRIGKSGPVVVTFVDDNLCRRTVAVPFKRSDEYSVTAMVEHVNDHVPLRPTDLDNYGT